MLVAAFILAHRTLLSGPPEQQLSYRPDWVLCSRYLEQGVLYDSGKPYCVHPPLLHYSIWLILKLVGLSRLDAAVWAVIVVSNAASYLLLKDVLGREGVKYNPAVYTALFLLLVTGNSSGQYDTTVSTTLMLAGFRTLYYGGLRRSFPVGGALIFLSVIMKAVAIPAAAVIFAHRFASAGSRRLETLQAPAVFALLSGATILAFKNVVEHTLTAHFVVWQYTLQEAAYALSPLSDSFTKQHLVVYVLGAYCAYLALRHRDSFSLLALAGVAVRVRHVFTGGLNVFSFSHYWLPYYAFLVAALLKERAAARKGSARDYIGLAVVVFTILYASPMSRLYPVSDGSIFPWVLELEGGLKYLPNGSILTGWENQYYLKPVIEGVGRSYSDFDFDYVRGAPDYYWVDLKVGRRMLAAGMIANLTTEGDEPLTAEESSAFGGSQEDNSRVMERLAKAEYSMLLLAPPAYDEMTMLIKKNLTKAYNCTAVLPNAYYRTKGGVHLTTVFFKDRAACEATRRSVAEYYLDAYGGICSRSGFAANFVKNTVFPLNGYKARLDQAECNFENDWFMDKTDLEGGTDFKPWEMMASADAVRLALMLSAILVAYYAALGRLPGKAPRRRRGKPP